MRWRYTSGINLLSAVDPRSWWSVCLFLLALQLPPSPSRLSEGDGKRPLQAVRETQVPNVDLGSIGRRFLWQCHLVDCEPPFSVGREKERPTVFRKLRCHLISLAVSQTE